MKNKNEGMTLREAHDAEKGMTNEERACKEDFDTTDETFFRVVTVQSFEDAMEMLGIPCGRWVDGKVYVDVKRLRQSIGYGLESVESIVDKLNKGDEDDD